MPKYDFKFNRLLAIKGTCTVWTDTIVIKMKLLFFACIENQFLKDFRSFLNTSLSFQSLEICCDRQECLNESVLFSKCRIFLYFKKFVQILLVPVLFQGHKNNIFTANSNFHQFIASAGNKYHNEYYFPS